METENWCIDSQAILCYDGHMLIQTLLERQREMGLYDGAFARELGISRPFWNKIRNGQRRPGVVFLRAVAVRFPDLQPHCLIFLQSKLPEERENRPAGNGHGARS